MERGTTCDDCVAAFPSVTPVCAASIATGDGAGPPPHPVDELVPPRRGALRRVRHELPGVARVRVHAVAHRHDLQHEHRAPVADDADGVRDARRRRRAHRRHDVPDVPRPPPPRAARRDGAGAARRHRVPPRRLRAARVLLRRHLRLAPDAAAARSSACPGVRDQHTGCVGAYLVEHDLFDFLLLSLPDNDTHSHKHGPYAQVTSLAAADRQLERLMHAAGGPRRVPRGPCGDRLLRPLAVAGGGRDRPVRRVRRLRRAARPRRRRTSAEIALCPSSRARAGLRARPRSGATSSSARRATLLALEGVDLVMHLTDHPDGEAAVAQRRAASCASRRGGDLADPRGGAGASRATLGVLGARGRRRRRPLAPPTRTRSAASGRRCAAARPGECCSRPGRATSSSTGGGRPHRRRLPRLAARQRLARLAAVVRHGAGAAATREQWSLRDVAPMVLDHFGRGGARAGSRIRRAAPQDLLDRVAPPPGAPDQHPVEPRVLVGGS